MKQQDITDQAIGVVVEQRFSALQQAQEAYQRAVASNLAKVITKAKHDLEAAYHEVDKLRDFVANLGHILGSDKTKHGEIAEQVEVRLNNAREFVRGLKPTGDVESLPRLGPVDYTIGNTNIQSKFCNGPRNTFNAIKGHLSKYPDFIKEGGIYNIPKDQHDIIMKALNDVPVEGMRGTTLLKLKKDILQLEEETGISFENIVKPSTSTYDEVQLGKVGNTIAEQERKLTDTTKKRIDGARKEAKKKHEQGKHITDPSWNEAVKTAAIGAAIGGAMQGGAEIWHKIHKEGKKITDFNKEDWKDIGITFGKGATIGGIAGISIYGLTRVAGYSEPLSSALVSSAISIYSLYTEYNNGRISQAEFIEAAYASSFESAMCCAGATLGALVIPPPFGAVVGTLVTYKALKIVEIVCDEQGLIKKMEEEHEAYKQQLDLEITEVLKPIFDFYNKFDSLVEMLSDKETNQRLKSSIELCQLVHIQEEDIIKDENELDRFIRGGID